MRELVADGEWVAFPTYEESDQSAFEMVVAGRLDGDDVAVMMVEAGGTNTWELWQNGTPKVDEDTLAGGLEACKVWIRSDRTPAGVHRARPHREDGGAALDRLQRRDLPAVEAAGTERIAETRKIADKTDRQNAEARSTLRWSLS